MEIDLYTRLGHTENAKRMVEDLGKCLKKLDVSQGEGSGRDGVGQAAYEMSNELKVE